MSIFSWLCPYAVKVELLHYPCCKIQNYAPVGCPSDYKTCQIFKNNKI